MSQRMASPPGVRNRAFTAVVEKGFQLIAIESDAVAALTVDAYIRCRGHDLDATMAEGFSHGFDRLGANRELVAWMRTYNQTQASDLTLAFYGFDGRFEMTHAPSPRYLEQLRQLPDQQPRSRSYRPSTRGTGSAARR